MSWACGFDSRWNRDVGYGVPATCDHPGCDAGIDRGLSYVCGGAPYGGECGCGLFFCEEHRSAEGLCGRCEKNKPPFSPSPDTSEWSEWKLTDESWAQWRAENPEEAAAMKAALGLRDEATLSLRNGTAAGNREASDV